jgi:hypothetical protein
MESGFYSVSAPRGEGPFRRGLARGSDRGSQPGEPEACGPISLRKNGQRESSALVWKPAPEPSMGRAAAKSNVREKRERLLSDARPSVARSGRTARVGL